MAFDDCDEVDSDCDGVLDEDDGTKFEAAILFKELAGDALDRIESYISSRI